VNILVFVIYSVLWHLRFGNGYDIPPVKYLCQLSPEILS